MTATTDPAAPAPAPAATATSSSSYTYVIHRADDRVGSEVPC